MTYLLRVNFDIQDKNPIKAQRFQCAIQTIKKLNQKGGKVVIVSHFGRPNGQDPEFSLKRFKKPLEKSLKKKVMFFPNFNFPKIRAAILAAGKTEIFLLENIRFLPGEKKNSAALAKQLASLADCYINDDFATSHRKDASIFAITKFLPSKPGPTLLKEVANLNKVMTRPKKPLTLIIGGAKIKDKISVIYNLLNKANKILLGGGAANTFLKASGVDIKSSLYDPEIIKEVKKLIINNKKIIIPFDSRWDGNEILDIGPKTISKYKSVIKKSGTVIWGGPMGCFEDKRFARGSYEIARAIAASRAFSVVGGAETGEIITRLKLQHKIDLLSTGGGAMLAYLAGEGLPGLKALKIKHQNG
jgi:phosphoglycerate kinase